MPSPKAAQHVASALPTPSPDLASEAPGGEQGGGRRPWGGSRSVGGRGRAGGGEACACCRPVCLFQSPPPPPPPWERLLSCRVPRRHQPLRTSSRDGRGCFPALSGPRGPGSGPAECDRFFGPGALHSWPVPPDPCPAPSASPRGQRGPQNEGSAVPPCSGRAPAALLPSPLLAPFPSSVPFPPEPAAAAATRTGSAVLPVRWDSPTVLESLAIFLPNIIVSTTGPGAPSAPGPSRVSGALQGQELVADSASSGRRF